MYCSSSANGAVVALVTTPCLVLDHRFELRTGEEFWLHIFQLCRVNHFGDLDFGHLILDGWEHKRDQR